MLDLNDKMNPFTINMAQQFLMNCEFSLNSQSNKCALHLIKGDKKRQSPIDQNNQ